MCQAFDTSGVLKFPCPVARAPAALMPFSSNVAALGSFDGANAYGFECGILHNVYGKGCRVLGSLRRGGFSRGLGIGVEGTVI